MALSMDEQRMLAEIERRLAAEDPGLASRLSAFRRPGSAGGLKSARGRVIASVCVVALLAIIGLTVYAMLSLRSYQRTQLGKQPSATSSASALRNVVPATAVNKP